MSSPSFATQRLTNSVDLADPVREAVEQERLRLAQDLHDDLGGRLMALKMALAPLLSAPAEAETEVKIASQAQAAQADKLLDQAIDAMRAALHRLRPHELDLGLVVALQQMADDFTSPALHCRFASDQPEIDAAPEVTLGLLRICREALANIVRHAQATQVDIRLFQGNVDSTHKNALLLDIADDGAGYHADAPDSASITRRVQALGGVLERRSTNNGAGPGCHLHIHVPIAPRKHGSR